MADGGYGKGRSHGDVRSGDNTGLPLTSLAGARSICHLGCFVVSVEVLSHSCVYAHMHMVSLSPADSWMTVLVRMYVQPTFSCVPEWVIFHMFILDYAVRASTKSPCLTECHYSVAAFLSPGHQASPLLAWPRTLVLWI